VLTTTQVRDKAAQHDPNKRDPDGERTPLHWAAARGHSRCAVVLLKAGADPAQRERSSGLTCARLAAAHGHERLATLLERQCVQWWQQQQAPPTPEGMQPSSENKFNSFNYWAVGVAGCPRKNFEAAQEIE